MSDEQSFKGEAQAIGAGLDLLVSLDEPEELMVALKKVADGHRGEKWEVISAHAKAAIDQFERLNAPRDER